jgi:hypothetical protein
MSEALSRSQWLPDMLRPIEERYLTGTVSVLGGLLLWTGGFIGVSSVCMLLDLVRVAYRAKAGLKRNQQWDAAMSLSELCVRVTASKAQCFNS